MSELLDRQRLFARLLPRLLDYIIDSGHTVTMGEAWRSAVQAELYAMGPSARLALAASLDGSYPALAADIRALGSARGIRASVHCDRLAVDLNIFDSGGNLLQSKADYAPFGAFWKSLDSLCKWGGDFGDADHFSIESPEGRS